MNFVEELQWRGMIHDMMPGTGDYLAQGMGTAYVGIDPTADSLHIGHLVGVMMLKHFQRCGHKPLALIGGATGMIGDPSGKSQERNLLDEASLHHNQECIKAQLIKFLNFDPLLPNNAELVNNYDWMKDYTFLGFIRDIGKHITINYMISKESVKKRIEGDAASGMSFTEFTYQLVQGYDFLYLYRTKNCRLQMGGSDQWGNITTGSELIRRLEGGEAYALTCPLIAKADGNKFGKTEDGNVWLDPQKTSPYQFYQFWLNSSDEDAGKYIRIFTLFSRQEVEEITTRHFEAPHLRFLQKALARDLTVRVHGETDYEAALEASELLFGKGTTEALKKLDEQTLLLVFEGVPTSEIAKSDLDRGLPVIEFLSDKTGIFASRGEARRMVKDGGVLINKEKISDDLIVSACHLLNDRYLLVQKGKKNYFLVKAV